VLTFFTTAKPFKGHNAIIQRNALQSWKMLHSRVEVILFGDEEGASQVSADYGLRHEPYVERFKQKLPYVNFMFARAEQIGRHNVLCYANCDMILTADFCRAVEQVRIVCPQFLIVGRRWDSDIVEPIDFSNPSWQEQTRRAALSANNQRDEWWIDYFVFSRGLFGSDMPPMVVGRPCWDNFTVWKALQKHPVVDASRTVLAVHQNHGYEDPQGHVARLRGEDARRNLGLAGGRGHLRTIAHATLILDAGGLRPNLGRGWAELKSRTGELLQILTYKLWLPAWHFLLDITRPIRTALGLRSKGVTESKEEQ